jgi:alpha-amylase/alpha-mannosidase (GH57 family)
MNQVYLAFLWHMHQPYYKNLSTGEYLLPWVLLHGTKDYFDMAFLLKDFPGLRQNFNVVPSLLVQLEDYDSPNVKDVYLKIFRKRPRDLTPTEKDFLLSNFFNANWEHMVRPYSRYYDLLRKRGFYYSKDRVREIQNYFSEDDLRDLQVLFFLAWIDPMFFEVYDELKVLRAKGKLFQEEDKVIIEDVQRRILKGIIPLYRELASEERIELSTSPFYHPIIPLLINHADAREAMPNVVLPEPPFSRPEDASRQIEQAITLFRKVFGSDPQGMWPPEGSVSDAALKLYARHGVDWVATDEDILFYSLFGDARRHWDGFLANPEMLYRPYRYTGGDGEITILFRDRHLSDLISFHYSKADPREAAFDCIRKIREIGDSVSGRIKKPLVTIAMDGENAWENYSNDGVDFLRYLYEGILNDDSIIPTTISNYLREAEDFGSLQHCFAGSWISHNFSIWVGHPEDNTGWTYLSQARDFLQKNDANRENEEAWESIYAAEGSDWFWWYGDEHGSENDEVFDFLFRENLANVYRFLGEQPPELLSIPILTENRESRPTREPANFLHPKIDGRVTNYFEWMGSGLIESRGHGVAMHDSSSPIKACWFGFDEEALYLRLDLDKMFIVGSEKLSFDIHIMTRGTTCKATYSANTSEPEGTLAMTAAFTEIFEAAITFDDLGAKKGDVLDVWCSLRVNDMVVDRIPKRGFLAIKVPSETFELEMWYV